MKFGINTLLWSGGFSSADIGLLAKFKQMGFDVAELARFEFADFPVAETRRALAETGLEPVLCSALVGKTSLVSDDPAVRREAREFIAGGIRTAAAIGAKIFAGPYCAPVGYLPGRRPNADEWNWAVEGLQSLGPDLAQHGVTLALEPLNRFETYFANTAAVLARLCDEVGHPNVGILYDTFHANIEEKSQGAAIRAGGKHIKHVHACENDRGIPGSGHVEWPQVFAALKEIGYDGCLTIESFGSQIPEIAAAACIWRDLAPSADAIAVEGLRFLKKMAG